MSLKKEEDKFISKVTLEILANNDHNILEVMNLEIIKSIFFEKDEYLILTKLIKDQKFDLVKKFVSRLNEGFEFLDIVTFIDQNGRSFAAAIYDNNELWQDPQVIELFYVK